jgi:hypothetical protein
MEHHDVISAVQFLGLPVPAAGKATAFKPADGRWPRWIPAKSMPE